jgi:hypothetical protein
MHDFWPCVQLLVHVRPHMALGALPVHTCGDAHVFVVDTKRHVFASLAQVACVSPSWHTVPVAVQIDGLHVHAAAPPLTVHDWCVPHVCVVTHAVHPLVCT